MCNNLINFKDLLPDANENEIESILVELASICRYNVEKTYTRGSFITFSAGIDSSILSELVIEKNKDATLLTLGRENYPDHKAASLYSLRKRDNLRLILQNITTKEIEEASFSVSKLVKVSNLSHFEDCVSFWLTARAARQRSESKSLISANGPDELFCGYDRFRRLVDSQGYRAVDLEIKNALLSAEKLSDQISKVVSEFDFRVEQPFLEREFREFALSIPSRLKILLGNDLLRKRIWRCFGRMLGIPDSTVKRQKKAMQYGMGIHSVVLPLVKRNKIDLREELQKS